MSGLGHTPRRGVAAVWALVVLTFVSALAAVAASRFAGSRQEVDGYRNHIQAEWLARAGYEFAVDRLLADPKNYQGETITPMPRGEVKIKVTALAEKKDCFEVESVARYPVGDRKVVVQTLRRTLKRVEAPPGVKIEPVPGSP
jgi:type II secretory pathway component PulK